MPCGYVGGYISCVERGEVKVSDEFCEKVCTAYGVMRNWLLDDEVAVEPIIYVERLTEESDSSLHIPGDKLLAVLQESGLSQREFCSKIRASTLMLNSLMDGRR